MRQVGSTDPGRLEQMRVEEREAWRGHGSKDIPYRNNYMMGGGQGLVLECTRLISGPTSHSPEAKPHVSYGKVSLSS